MKKDTNPDLLQNNFNKKIKQINDNFASLMERVISIDSSSGLKQTQEFAIDFSQKIINELEKLTSDFPEFVNNWGGLPPFIKQGDILTLIERIPPIGLSLTRFESWTRRLAYGDSDTITATYNAFKEKITQTGKIYTVQEDKDRILTSLERFENGTLAIRSNYEKKLRKTDRAYQDLVTYKETTKDVSELTAKRALILTGILNAISAIPHQLEDAELQRFKNSEAFQLAKKTDEHLLLSQRHMRNYMECRPLTKQIEFLNSILTSQQSSNEETRNKYNVLFKHRTNPKGLWKRFQQIDTSPILKLTALRDALVAAEEARTNYVEEDSQLPKPLLKGDPVSKAQEQPRKESPTFILSEETPPPAKDQPKPKIQMMAENYQQKLAERGIFRAEKKPRDEIEPVSQRNLNPK